MEQQFQVSFFVASLIQYQIIHLEVTKQPTE